MSDFNRQLSSLQRSVPTRGMAPMRSMARPLTQSPLARPAATGRPGQLHRSASLNPATREHAAPMAARRTHGAPRPVRHGDHGHRQASVQRSSSVRQDLRRRRTNVLFMLLMTTGGSLFLAATTKANVMMYAFALSFLALCGYCYKLVQLRNAELDRSSYSDNTWFRAA